VLDALGLELGDQEFPATTAGYQALLGWLCSFGVLVRVGVESTSSYGAGRKYRCCLLSAGEVVHGDLR
jgi:transposase